MIAKPNETESTLDALLATTFVTRVDRATLSVIAPLLSKCLKSRQSNMHRKAGMVSRDWDCYFGDLLLLDRGTRNQNCK